VSENSDEQLNLWRYQCLMAYIHGGQWLADLYRALDAMKLLGRVGVTFTSEQQARIQAMVEGGDTVGAQRAILDELGKS
jgi:hypothetical protein